HDALPISATGRAASIVPGQKPKRAAELRSTQIFEHVQAGVPVARIDQSIPRDIEIGCFGGERDVGPRVDQFGRRGRQPERQLLWCELILEIENAHPAGVVGGENGLLALERAWAVLMQIVRTERAGGGAVVTVTRYRHG